MSRIKLLATSSLHRAGNPPFSGEPDGGPMARIVISGVMLAEFFTRQAIDQADLITAIGANIANYGFLPQP